MTKLICIDIGGTAIKYGVARNGPEILDAGSMPTPADGAAIMDAVVERVRSCRLAYPEAEAVCVSSAGIINSEEGFVAVANEKLIPGYGGMRIADRIRSAAGLPCHVENDVNCAALAEYYAGAARGCSSCLMLTVGTGIGGAFIQKGELLKGHCYSACEVGYLHMDGTSFEELGATSVLCRKTAEALRRPLSATDGKWIFGQARAGNAVCVRFIDEMCQALSREIANLCYVLNPEVVIIGGGISAQEDFLRPRLESGIADYLIPPIAANTRLEFARLRNHAGMVGACYAAGFWK